MNNARVIEKLLSWMERSLNQKADFSADEIGKFFADHFVIQTNSRIVQATPATYREYLYKLKSTLAGVKYEVEEMLETSNAVIVPFVIQMNFVKKTPQKLQAISIFKMNPEHRIVEWKEVFTNVEQQNFAYDPS